MPSGSLVIVTLLRGKGMEGRTTPGCARSSPHFVSVTHRTSHRGGSFIYSCCQGGGMWAALWLMEMTVKGRWECPESRSRSCGSGPRTVLKFGRNCISQQQNWPPKISSSTGTVGLTFWKGQGILGLSFASLEPHPWWGRESRQEAPPPAAGGSAQHRVKRLWVSVSSLCGEEWDWSCPWGVMG